MNDLPLPRSEDQLFAWASRIARGNDALADEALQHARIQFARGLFDPRRGSFSAWFQLLVRRYCSDARRYRFRAVGGDAPIPEVVANAADAPAFEARHDLTVPFCDADRSAVLRLDPRHRFVLLAWHGLWDKLSRDDQRQTLTVVKPAEPFPVADFFEWPNKDRTRYLARLMRCPPNTVAQIRHRYRHHLAALRFVRELRGA